jgi:L-rhamnose mutarotase
MNRFPPAPPSWPVEGASQRPPQTLSRMKIATPLALCAVLLAGCATRPAQRFAWVTGLKPEKAAYYEDLHAHPWPAVNRMLKQCHIRNFSIHQREIEGKLYLFAYLEYTGRDFEADMNTMAADPETQRWWKETDPCQSPLPDAAAKGKIWADTQEVYYLP